MRRGVAAFVFGLSALALPSPADAPAAPPARASGYLFIGGRGTGTPTQGRLLRLPAGSQWLNTQYGKIGIHPRGIWAAVVSADRRQLLARFELDTPNGEPVRPMTYRVVGGGPVRSRIAHVSVEVGLNTCDATDGIVRVDRADFGTGGTIRRFHAAFAIYCNEALEPVYGEVGIGVPAPRASPPLPPMPKASLTLTSEAGDTVGQGRPRRYVHLANSSVSAFMEGLGAVVQVYTDSPRPTWQLVLTPPYRHRLERGTYEHAIRPISQSPQSSAPGVEVTGEGRGCNEVAGRFVISELGRSPAGALRRLHATFEQHCDGAAPALRGEVVVRVPVTLR